MRKKTLFWLIILCLAVYAFFSAVNYLSDPNNYRDFLVKKLSATLNQPLEIEKINLEFTKGFGFSLHKVIIGKAPDEIKAEKLFMSLKLRPLLVKQFVIQKIIITSPLMNIRRDEEGKYHTPFDNFLPGDDTETPADLQFSIDLIVVNQGQLDFADEFKEGSFAVSLKELNLIINDFNPQKPLQFELKTKTYKHLSSDLICNVVTNGVLNGLFSSSTNGSTRENQNDVQLKTTGKISECNLANLQPFLADYAPWQNMEGLAETNFELTGSFRKGLQAKMDVKVKAGKLTYPEYLKKPLPIDYIDCVLDLVVKPVKESPKSNYQYDINLKRIRVQVVDGNIKSDGKVFQTDTTYPGYKLNIEADGINLVKLNGYLTNEKSKVSGKAAFKGRLSNPGRNADRFDGQLSLNITQGNINKFNILARIFSLANPVTLFKRPPGLDKKGFPFKSITANLIIKKGVVQTEDLVLDSPAWKIMALGQINLPAEELDLKVYVQPLRNIDEVVSKIPVFGKILQGKKGSFLDTYFTVRGKIADPQIKARPLSSLSENAWGILTRTLSMPVDLIKAIPFPGKKSK